LVIVLKFLLCRRTGIEIFLPLKESALFVFQTTDAREHFYETLIQQKRLARLQTDDVWM